MGENSPVDLHPVPPPQPTDPFTLLAVGLLLYLSLSNGCEIATLQEHLAKVQKQISTPSEKTP